jgi:hypothetical protein
MPGSLDDSFLMHETASFTQKAADTGKRRLRASDAMKMVGPRRKVLCRKRIYMAERRRLSEVTVARRRIK